jgi:hypothetical protein
MKKKAWVFLLGFLALASVAVAARVKIVTQEATIRKDKRFFAPAVAAVPYGTVIEELDRQGDWLRVSYQGKQGWLHASAVSQQKLDLSGFAGQRADETSREEVALAGKGFTPQVEAAMREKNPSMRYDLVDRIQGYAVPEGELLAFLQAGNLKQGGARP